jgi:hypothetical protein
MGNPKNISEKGKINDADSIKRMAEDCSNQESNIRNIASWEYFNCQGCRARCKQRK